MKTRASHIIIVKSSTPPSVEVDTEAAAVYVRFKRGKIARTISRSTPNMHIAVDVDKDGEVIGVEAVGIREVQIGRILKMAAVEAPNVDFAQARYIPTHLVTA